MARSTLVVVKLLDTPHKRIYIYIFFFFFFKEERWGDKDMSSNIFCGSYILKKTSPWSRLAYVRGYLKSTPTSLMSASRDVLEAWAVWKQEMMKHKFLGEDSLPFRSPASRTRAAGWKINRLQGWVNAETNSRQTRRCKNHSWLPAYGGRNVKKLCLSTLLCFRSLQNYFPG